MLDQHRSDAPAFHTFDGEHKISVSAIEFAMVTHLGKMAEAREHETGHRRIVFFGVR